MKIISQGRAYSPYFCVTVKVEEQFTEGEEIRCTNPRTGKSINGVFAGQFTWLWAEIPDSFCLLNFGMNAADYRLALTEAKPEFRDIERIKIVIILETKQ